MLDSPSHPLDRHTKSRSAGLLKKGTVNFAGQGDDRALGRHLPNRPRTAKSGYAFETPSTKWASRAMECRRLYLRGRSEWIQSASEAPDPDVLHDLQASKDHSRVCQLLTDPLPLCSQIESLQCLECVRRILTEERVVTITICGHEAHSQ